MVFIFKPFRTPVLRKELSFHCPRSFVSIHFYLDGRPDLILLDERVQSSVLTSVQGFLIIMILLKFVLLLYHILIELIEHKDGISAVDKYHSHDLKWKIDF